MQKASTITELIEYALHLNQDQYLEELRIGLGYTVVKLSSGSYGMACLLRHRLGIGGCSLLSQAGTLAGSEVAALIPWLSSSNVVEASVGLAVINALAAQTPSTSSPEDIFETLQIQQSERVGMVGDIEPVVRQLKDYTGKVFVFDEGKPGKEGISSVKQEAELLPWCHVLILSSTCLLNHSFDELLGMASQAREICLMGPSTPLIPEFFRARGITLLAGRRVTDGPQLLKIVSEAGGTKRFKDATRKVNVRIQADLDRSKRRKIKKTTSKKNRGERI